MKKLSFSLGLLLLLVATVVFAQPTSYPFEFTNADSTSTLCAAPGTPVYYGYPTAVPIGKLVQIIKPGTDAFLDSALTGATTAGMVGTGNTLVTSFDLGNGTTPANAAGYWDYMLSANSVAGNTTSGQITTGGTFWCRVWYDVAYGATYGTAAFAGKHYCDGGPYIVPPNVANPPLYETGNFNIHMIGPDSLHPTWHTLAGGATAPIFGITVNGVSMQTSYGFGTINVGSTGRVPVVISNTGNASLTLTGSFLHGTGKYTWSNALPASIAATGSINDTLIFTPTAAGLVTDTVQIAHNAAGSPYICQLTGTGNVPGNPIFGMTVNAVSLPTAYGFGNVVIASTGRVPVVISNTGTASLTLTGSFLQGTGKYTWSNALPASIAPAGSINDTLIFSPTAAGLVTDTVQIAHNAVGSPYKCALTGTGIVNQVLMIVRNGTTTLASGNTITFPSTAVGSTSTIVLTIIDSSGSASPLTLNTFTATGVYTTTTPASPVAIGGNVTVTLRFHPLAANANNPGTFSFQHNSTSTNPFTLTLGGASTAYSNTGTPAGNGNPWGFPNDPGTGNGTNTYPPFGVTFNSGTAPTGITLGWFILRSGLFAGDPYGGVYDSLHTVMRYFDVAATGGTGYLAQARFYFTDYDIPSTLNPPTSYSPWYAYGYNVSNHTWTQYSATITLFAAGTPNVWLGTVNNVNGFSQWELSTQNPLPVTALTFSANAGDREVGLRWHVEAEVSNSYYRLERRSVTENTDWIEIYRMPSHAPNGTSGQPLDYSYVDSYNLIDGVTYQYRIADVGLDGVGVNRAIREATPRAPIVTDYALSNYPNPFNPETRISYTMKAEGKVKITVTNVMGQVVATLVNNETVGVGTHVVAWHADNMPSGLYFLNMETPGFNAMRKMVLAK